MIGQQNELSLFSFQTHSVCEAIYNAKPSLDVEILFLKSQE